jgi:hypothetical protein
MEIIDRILFLIWAPILIVIFFRAYDRLQDFANKLNKMLDETLVTVKELTIENRVLRGELSLYELEPELSTKE